MSPNRLKAYLLLTLATVFWAIATPVIKFVLNDLSPLPFLAYRFGLTTLAIIILSFFIKIKIPKKLSTILLLLFYSFMTSTVTLGILFFGLKETTVIESTIISMAGPVLIALAGVYYLKEHVTKKEKLGMTIALIGTALTVIEPIIRNGAGRLQLSGNLLIVLYLLTNTVSVVLAKSLLRKGVTSWTMIASTFVVGFVSILPFLYLNGGGIIGTINEIKNLSLTNHLGVVYMAIVSGLISYDLSNRAQKTIEIGDAAMFQFLYPIIAIPLAVFWLKETLTLPYILGALIISVGVIIASFKRKNKK